MKTSSLRYYLQNCFLLTIPILIWNLALTDDLPEPFQPERFGARIPPVLAYGETIFRMGVFVLAFLMPLRLTTNTQKNGFYLYLFGLAVYFASWLALLVWPDCRWSRSLAGFAAPAYTPVLWLAGIALMGHSFYFGLPFRRWVFGLVSLLFLGFHVSHAVLVYSRLPE
ncbi:hypothetical protein ACFPMF_04345 [Larkinella bovis]|uniref:Uncharacterized protein n=1 Tax=Larkinella bovis TaxID=683041 RepID=A0ABW0I5C7_9BACT